MLKIIEKDIDQLIPYENNPRNNDRAVEAVAASIKNFGFKIPVVIDKDDVVVCGHTRIKSAKRLGMKKVPCIIADDLTEEQIRAFRLADNKTGEIAEWDFEKLEEELRALDDIDMGQFGFDQLQAFFQSLGMPKSIKRRSGAIAPTAAAYAGPQMKPHSSTGMCIGLSMLPISGI